MDEEKSNKLDGLKNVKPFNIKHVGCLTSSQSFLVGKHRFPAKHVLSPIFQKHILKPEMIYLWTMQN